MKRDSVTLRDMSRPVTRPIQRDKRDNTLRGVTDVTVGQHGHQVACGTQDNANRRHPLAVRSSGKCHSLPLPTAFSERTT